jgi:crossover junction endodeoxyribonuclease RuvC
MVALLLGLDSPPEPHDAADALAVALCHAHRFRFEEKVETGQRGVTRSSRKRRR